MVKELLNTDKKELFIVEEVGTIEKEHYNNRTYNTLTLKVKTPTLQERLTSAIKMFKLQNTVILI